MSAVAHSSPAGDVAQTDLVATLTDLDQLRSLDSGALRAASWLEVRADLVGDLDPVDLRGRFDGELLYTLRSEAEGGRFAGGDRQREQRLRAACAAGYDLIDFEIARDVAAARQVPERNRLLSWHDDFALDSSLIALRRQLERLDSEPARFRKLIASARTAAASIVPLQLLAEVQRRDLICFATGEVGSWTRVVAPRLGSVFVYGSASSEPAAPGQLSIGQLVDNWGLPQLPPIQALCGIVGAPVSHSLSPRIHNGAYRELGLPLLFLAFEAPSFGEFWLDVVESEVFELLGAPLVGLSVTAPHKKAALAVAGASSPRAQRIDSANTLVRRAGVWEAESTDPEGVSEPVGQLLGDRMVGGGATALVLGSGGAGRAAVAGLAELGLEVVLCNRTEERGRRFAERLGVQFLPTSALRESDYDVLVNATSLGHRQDDGLAFDPAAARDDAIVVDMVYRNEPTALLQEASARGLGTVDGREVLLFQAVEQFRRMTGKQLPLASAAARIGLELDSSSETTS